MSIDLDIKNYDYNDILNLFKIDKHFTFDQLIKCKDTVLKLHPSNSSLNIEYFNLFNDAYKLLEEQFNKQKRTMQIDKPFEKHYGLDVKRESCYAPSIFTTKMVTIHTEDRDVLKHPYENNFEVELPCVIKNTQSIELFDITLPSFYYNISEYLQNNKFFFSIPLYFDDPVELTLPSGQYTYSAIAMEIENQLKNTTSKELYKLGVYVSPDTLYTFFSVAYSEIERRFTFHNSKDAFVLHLDKKSSFDHCTIDCWKMLNNWGLGYNLGFYKKMYASEFYTNSSNAHFIKAPKISELDIYNTIYMEISTYNWIDEIYPFSISTTDMYNNDFNGSVNNSFAKLVLSTVSNTYVPIQKFTRTLPHMVEKILRLKFKFRYHNGILVDFMQQPFNFALKFECRVNCA